jgi:hypothetical protein
MCALPISKRLTPVQSTLNAFLRAKAGKKSNKEWLWGRKNSTTLFGISFRFITGGAAHKTHNYSPDMITLAWLFFLSIRVFKWRYNIPK